MKYQDLVKEGHKKALVTGGSSGIGCSFCYELAKDGFSITILARRLSLLEELKRDLEGKFGVQVTIISVDLSKTHWRSQMNLESLEFDLVVHSAGDGYPGEFGTMDMQKDEEIVQLNCTTPMQLTHEILPFMKRKGGAIIFISSTMAYIGIPLMANYSATKAFILNFGEALHQELKDYNISVEVLTPGATKTPALEKYEVDYDALPVRWMNSEQVAQMALNNLGNKVVVIPGWTNWLTAGMSSCLITRSQIQKLMKNFSNKIIKKQLD